MGWQEVSRRFVCPVCKHPKWCGFTDDGAMVCCMRIREGAWKPSKNGGWLHKLKNGLSPARPRPAPRLASCSQPMLDCQALQRKFQGDLDHRFDLLVKSLGVTDTSLHQLGVGYSREYGAFTFPMRRARGEIAGFRLRNLSGRKWTFPGTHNGLFISRYAPGDGPLLIVEGPTNVAALLSVGLAAIGRPSNTGGMDELINYCRNIRRQIYILHDRDTPGSDAERLTEYGAFRLAEILQPNQVFVSCPPVHKDARAWINDGATASIIRSVFQCANPYVSTRKTRMKNNFAEGAEMSNR